MKVNKKEHFECFPVLGVPKRGESMAVLEQSILQIVFFGGLKKVFSCIAMGGHLDGIRFLLVESCF